MSPFQPPLKSSRFALAVAMAAILALAACDRADEVTAPAPVVTGPATTQPTATAPSPFQVTSITLGTSAGDELRIPVPMTTFTSSDQIIVSVDTSGAADNAEVTTRLVYQEGQTAREQSGRITTSVDETTNMTFTNANG